MRTRRAISKRRGDRPPSSQRCHQRCAVAGETLKQAAARLSDIPASIASTSSRRPASPSFALACRFITALLWAQVLADPHSLKGGPDVTLSRSQPLWAAQLAEVNGDRIVVLSQIPSRQEIIGVALVVGGVVIHRDELGLPLRRPGEERVLLDVAEAEAPVHAVANRARLEKAELRAGIEAVA